MVNLLPAVLIGGPPHAGKSVLFYALTHALRERGIRHHAIRACPDGEGNWSQESDADTVSKIRLPLKEAWPESFIKRICLDLEHRCLPFLIDIGGRPNDSQLDILRQCTHSVLLLRADKPDYTELWQRLVTESDLLPLAQIYSQVKGESMIASQSPILEGTLVGLERNITTPPAGPLFPVLVDRIATLFNSYSLKDLERVFFEQAPTELLVDLYSSLQTLVPSATRWEPDMLRSFLASLPAHTPMSVYGAGPLWLYAAMAAYSEQEEFYQFDPRIGWIRPIPLSISTAQLPEVLVQRQIYGDVAMLSINIVPKHLDYFQPEALPFPAVPAEAGLIIDGVIPAWLITALVRLYKEAGVAWIACYYPPSKQAIVVYSSVETQKLGDLVVMPVG
ncbi:MAG: CRISPR-associated protein Csx3 [Ktedonobacteraceae bacterium]